MPGFLTTVIILSIIDVIIVNARPAQVVTDHAVYRGQKLVIGNEGNGSCKYSGDWKITPAWVLRNNEATYAVSAGENMYPKFLGEGADLRLQKSWEMKYSLEIETDNTTLAGRYTCQYSDKPEEVQSVCACVCVCF